MDNKYVEMKFLRKQNGRILKHKKKNYVYYYYFKIYFKIAFCYIKKEKEKKIIPST